MNQRSICFILLLVAIGLAHGQEAPMFSDVATIRDAVAVRCDWGSASAQIKMGIFTDDWESLEKLIDADRHAVMCQGAAYALHLKYKSLGYRSYLTGLKNSEYSHAICLVEVAVPERGRKLAVMDPSFNVSFTDEAGVPLSIYELMTLANRGQASRVRVAEGQPVRTLYLQSKKDPLSKRHAYRDDLKYSTPEFDVYTATLSLKRFATAHHAHITRDCERKGLPVSAVSATYAGEPIYVYCTYPMSPAERAEADPVFEKLQAHFQSEMTLRKQRLRAGPKAGD